MTWLVKTYYVELDLGERLELGRKDWDTAHGEGGERVVSLASSTKHIGERCVPTLGGALECDIFCADIAIFDHIQFVRRLGMRISNWSACQAC